VHPDHVSEFCTQNCLTNGTDCEVYSTCEPLDPISFEYVCEDGSAPMENGCCNIPDARNPDQTIQGCPMLCDDRTVYAVPQPNGPRSGLECMCFQCPTNLPDISYKCSQEWLNDLEERGQLLLLDIKRQVGLNDITPTMQLLMSERDAEIAAAIEANNGYCDQGLQEEVLRITNKWEGEITQEAERQLDCYNQNGGEYCVDDDDDDDGSSVGIVVGVAIAAIVVCGGSAAFGAYWFAKKNSANQAQGGRGIQPREGDNEVVVGRPIQGEQGAASAVGGAPVAPAAADDDAKGQGSKPPPQSGGEPVA